MGIRCDQFMGLNKWALNFVKGKRVRVCTEEVTRIYPNGVRQTLAPRPVYESSVKMEESGESYYGMFMASYPLHKYTFLNGRVYCEKVQAAPWSSGPVYFLALQDESGNLVPKSLWADEEIAAA